MIKEKRRVNYAQSVHGEEEISAVLEVLKTSTQMGPNVSQFESAVAKLFAKQHGVMVNSGSSALMIAIEVLDLKPGSEVITPALTFSTTVATIIRAGLIPAFVDVEEGTYNIDVTKLESMVTSKTSAIIVPNLVGNLPDWDVIHEIANKHKLKVVEDSCDTLGAILRKESTGSRADISVTSFYGSHIINCAGNGGMLCLNDSTMLERAKLLRSWGRSSSLYSATESEKVKHRFNVNLEGISYDRKFVFGEIGYNLEPSEMGAAFGLVQLKKLQHNIDSRILNCQKHIDFFQKYKKYFNLPKQIRGARTAWLAFALTISIDAPFSRKDFQIFLEENDVQTRPIFTGNILRQPGFSRINHKATEEGYPVADSVMQNGVLIACHHGLLDDDVEYMHDVIDSFMSRYV